MPLWPPMHPARLRQPAPGPCVPGLWPGLADAVTEAACLSPTACWYARSSEGAERPPRPPDVRNVFTPGS